jgi:NTE family protein
MAKTVSLVLGCGGARGFAHIGAIEELLKRGYKINAISGSSMGAAVGGIYAAGKLTEFKEWAEKLTKMETFRLVDFTLTSQGFIRGEKIFTVLKEIIGERRIEDFDIPFTAVATDINKQEEVWLNKGELFSVIRASCAIPTLLTPKKLGNRLLIDGGVLNPLPVEPVLRTKSDLLVVVNINASIPSQAKVIRQEPITTESDAYMDKMVLTMKKWMNIKPTVEDNDETLGYFGLLNKSYDLMQDRMCLMSIIHHKPDYVVNISRDSSSTYEFYRAKDMIEEGRIACIKALEKPEAYPD